MNDSLAVLWVTKDKEAALNMVFMYTRNSKLRKWWGKVTLIIWGPSGPLLVSDAELQKELEALLRAQFGLRMQLATQQLSNTSQMKKVKRDIARVRTVMREKAAK